ncbi:MAG: GNAT family N-acetyltransferase [Clostridia bacterium]|nr:GNAT family N-acetyltransferase [Clostridia bacterium]
MINRYTLIKAKSFDEIDRRALMDVYSESNLENTGHFFPDMEDRTEAVKMVEEGFLGFLENEFFKDEGNLYWMLEKDGKWLAALRTTELEGRTFYIEALETHPRFRKQGYASRLIEGMIEDLKRGGDFRLRSCVDKQNTPSVAAHLHCGFSIADDVGRDLLTGESSEWEYSFEYVWRE